MGTLANWTGYETETIKVLELLDEWLLKICKNIQIKILWCEPTG